MADILIVEDEGLVGMNTEMVLEAMGHRVVGVISNGADALNVLEKLQPDLVLMDIALHGKMSGIEITRTINRTCQVPVVYMTAHTDSATMDKVAETRHFGILRKPFDVGQLEKQIQSVLAA